MTRPDPAPGAGRSGASSSRKLISGALLLAAVLFAVWTLQQNWDDVRSDLARLSVLDIVAAAAAYAGSLLLLWRSWANVLSGIGADHVERHDSLTIFFAGQLGKYVPGSVWPIVIQSQLGRRNGIAPSMMVNAYALFASLLCGTGAALGVLALFGPGVDVAAGLVLVAAVAGVALVVATIHDHGLVRLISWVLARIGRRSTNLRLETPAGLRSVAWATGSWLLLGVHIFALARPLGATAGDLGLIIGGFALAFVAGLVVVPLPAGAGVREAVLVLTIGAALGEPAAIAIALISRFQMIVVELLMATALGVPRAARWARSRSSVDASLE